MNTAQGPTLHIYVMMQEPNTQFENGDTLYMWPYTQDGQPESNDSPPTADEYAGWTHQQCYHLKYREIFHIIPKIQKKVSNQ